MGKISKAVIPAAGLGTRFLPATKALPKEMLPIVDKPVMQFVVEEAVSAGTTHILMVTGRNKNALENHFDRAIELESVLDSKGDGNKLSKVMESTALADIHYVRQGDPLGLGHAVSKARSFVGVEPFALLLGDEIIDAEEDLLKQMIKLSEETGANVVGLMEVPDSEVSKYGIAEFTDYFSPSIAKLQGLVEKPDLANAPSRYAVIGRYVLQPEIFDLLDSLDSGVGGEIQLTDALSQMAANPDLAGPVLGFIFTGKRYDTGDKLSFLKATVEIALDRPDLGSDFKSWLTNIIHTEPKK